MADYSTKDKISNLARKESRSILEQYLGFMGIIAFKDMLEECRKLKKKIF